MFEDLVESSPVPKKTNKPWTIVLSTLLQVTLLGILILIPLIYTEALPKTMLTTLLVAPPPPPPPPPPPAATPVKVTFSVSPPRRAIWLTAAPRSHADALTDFMDCGMLVYC